MHHTCKGDTVKNHLAFDALLDKLFKNVDNNFHIRVEGNLIFKHLPALQIGHTCLLYL